MIKKRFSFRGYDYVFIFKHYWDSEEMEERPWSTEFRDFHLGLVFKRYTKFEKSKSGFRLSNYMIGINLLVIKTWVIFTLPNFFKK